MKKIDIYKELQENAYPGKEYNMVRLFTFPVGKTVKVGFEAQAPMGEGGDRLFEDIVIENKTLDNLRAGI